MYDIGYLIYQVLNENKAEPVEIEVFLEQKSVSGTEFYKAIQSGINPEITFETRTCDYELTRHIEADTGKPLFATQIRYDGAVYDIIRAYYKPNSHDKTVMICG
jgi:hypothetical protein